MLMQLSSVKNKFNPKNADELEEKIHTVMKNRDTLLKCITLGFSRKFRVLCDQGRHNEKKPENVWLTYGNIVTINFDEETLTFICATDNGIVSFWEYKSGICMGCVHTEHNDLISDLHLLNPDNVPNISKFQNKLNKKQKISLKTDKIDKSSEMDDILVKYKTVSALVVTSCCELFYIDSNGLNLDNNLKELILNSEINANKITSIVNINGKYLLLCLKDGSLISFNTDTCDYETSFESSPEYDISEPWKVVYSFNRRFGKLYIVVNSTKNNDAKICVFEITKELQIEKRVQKESKNFDQIVKSILEEM
ncbi:hypothetical protein A3Q56_03413 [Intoshia linei]|uniref:Uncharacterized protein n=1 Tax=Intoshia linei TaxID=1819745 RepID=A0A177B5I6_9BILA|nr:hypothetical protein A3Q56_03413 [Intoshia linei]